MGPFLWPRGGPTPVTGLGLPRGAPPTPGAGGGRGGAGGCSRSREGSRQRVPPRGLSCSEPPPASAWKGTGQPDLQPGCGDRGGEGVSLAVLTSPRPLEQARDIGDQCSKTIDQTLSHQPGYLPRGQPWPLTRSPAWETGADGAGSWNPGDQPLGQGCSQKLTLLLGWKSQNNDLGRVTLTAPQEGPVTSTGGRVTGQGADVSPQSPSGFPGVEDVGPSPSLWSLGCFC